MSQLSEYKKRMIRRNLPELKQFDEILDQVIIALELAGQDSLAKKVKDIHDTIAEVIGD